jgi:hypothetical protein
VHPFFWKVTKFLLFKWLENNDIIQKELFNKGNHIKCLKYKYNSGENMANRLRKRGRLPPTT